MTVDTWWWWWWWWWCRVRSWDGFHAVAGARQEDDNVAARYSTGADILSHLHRDSTQQGARCVAEYQLQYSLSLSHTHTHTHTHTHWLRYTDEHVVFRCVVHNTSSARCITVYTSTSTHQFHRPPTASRLSITLPSPRVARSISDGINIHRVS